MVQRIKKDDLVQVVSGKDRGATGTIVSIDKKKNRVLVKGVGMITKHIKPKRTGEKGQILKEESYIHISNVMPVCPGTKKPCRVGAQVRPDGKRVRISKKNNEEF